MARFTRSSFVDILQEDYIRTARAKGLPEDAVVVKHGLRNALIPVVTMMGLQFGFLLGGSIVVEVVFNWPGLGRLLVDAVDMRDYPVIQALVLLFSLEFILINLSSTCSTASSIRRSATADGHDRRTASLPSPRPPSPIACARRGRSSGASSRRQHVALVAGAFVVALVRGRDRSRRAIVPYDAENFFDYDRLNAPAVVAALVRRRPARAATSSAAS